MHQEWLDGFALWLTAEGRSQQTVDQYRFCAARFLRSAGERGVTRATITAWRASMARRSLAYQAFCFNALKAFLRYLRDEEELDVPELTSKAPRVPLPDVKIPSDADIRALIGACQSARDEAVIRMLASTGMRLSECAGIRLEDLDLAGKDPQVHVVGKGRRPRYVPIHTYRTVKALRRYLRERQESPWASSPMLWLGERGPMSPHTVYRVVRRASQHAGVSIHPHQLRHYFCQEFQAGDGQVNELAELVGWTSLNQSMRYARASLGQRASERARSLAIGGRLLGPGRDKRPAAGNDADHALLAQAAERLGDGAARQAGLLLDLARGGQRCARGPRAVLDALAQYVVQLHPHRDIGHDVDHLEHPHTLGLPLNRQDAHRCPSLTIYTTLHRWHRWPTLGA